MFIYLTPEKKIKNIVVTSVKRQHKRVRWADDLLGRIVFGLACWQALNNIIMTWA